MRNTLVPVVAAVALFMMGVFILTLQLWFSARADSLAGARYAIEKTNAILVEARSATRIATAIAQKGCGVEGQYQLGTEAALEPHLRTIFIIKQGEVWCSSLSGNRILLINARALPAPQLLLVSAKNALNGLPVLLYQTKVADSRIVVTISDRHIRDALSVPLKGVTYRLTVGDAAIGTSGDVMTLGDKQPRLGKVVAADFPYSIDYTFPAIISLQRLIAQGGGILLFLLLIACLVAYVMYRYLNKNTAPEESLRSAIAKGEIVPFYQAVVNGREGSLRGVEVLARWKHPKAGYISPGSFIPVAEKSGLIVPLTRSLMAQVVTQMNAISSKLPEGFHVGVNFSASHIAMPGFIDECLDYKRRFVRQDLNLVIEVTEREPLDMDKDLITTLNALHDKGFAIALDDFGTGYSGLSYLHDLRIDYIKIDHSFVSRVNEHEESTRILDCVLDLARKLSISIVAEGVETKAQLDYLNRNNIVFQQGYYFFKPVPFTKLIHILLSKPKVKVVVE
ncbi:EAL domain-containing protein [Enterobacter sp. UNJFSC 003]|uniref:EAL domain-containing protein n=1 Tax=Enterobacter sp. UNJFSC 003 TaxID=3122077 RepID=UPI002EB7BD47|nr:EAL domain-containing protein [Serratia liquefaciens]